MRFLKSNKGFTLVELTIASVMLMGILLVITNTQITMSSAKRKITLASEVNNETRFLLERIVTEVSTWLIDYQGYWRENTQLGTVAIADKWISEGANLKGFKSNGNTNPIIGFNAIRNCGNPTADYDTWDYGLTSSRRNIIQNYRYQFINPGLYNDNPWGPYANNRYTGIDAVHLNCDDDNYNQLGKYNIYDDDKAYGKGPRAFCEIKSWVCNLDKNAALASKMLWTWQPDMQNAVMDNNPPLMLVKEDLDTVGTYVRTAFRQDKNRIKLIQFISEADGNTDPEVDSINDEWKCMPNFKCNDTYDWTYIWSQKDHVDTWIWTIIDPNLGWQDITPDNIDIIKFDFILSPVKDPFKSFAEKHIIQKPQVKIIITARAKQSVMNGIPWNAPEITLSTTVTPRIWDEIIVDN